jgi:hypothetical protein
MSGARGFSRSLLPLLIILSMAITPVVRGATSPIPARVQMLLFSKIWMFDRSVDAREEIVMAILYQSTFRASTDAKDQLIQAVRAEGLKVRCVPVALDRIDNVYSDLLNVKADVFYLTEMRGVDIQQVVDVSRARHIRTITVIDSYLAAGIAIGLRVRGDKPVIVVNLKAAKAEGSDLTGQLLKAATLIGDGTATP